eukprot:1037031-Pleurochrysis_carterae.AAC.7
MLPVVRWRAGVRAGREGRKERESRKVDCKGRQAYAYVDAMMRRFCQCVYGRALMCAYACERWCVRVCESVRTQVRVSVRERVRACAYVRVRALPARAA